MNRLLLLYHTLRVKYRILQESSLVWPPKRNQNQSLQRTGKIGS